MHGPRGHVDPLSELCDPFAALGNLRGHQSLIPGIIEGRGPFDHPFFTNPFGGLSESHPFGFSGGSPLMNTHPPGFNVGENPFMNAHPPHFPIGGSPFMRAHLPGFPIGGHPFMNAHPPNFPIGGSPFPNSPLPFGVGTEIPAMNVQPYIFPPNFPIGGSPFPNSPLPFGVGTEIPAMNVQPSNFLEQKSSQTNRSKGPIIEELDSDDEKEIGGQEENKDNPRMYDRSKREAFVEDQDYQSEGMNKRQMLCFNESKSANNTQPSAQGHSFTFQSSTVMHGGSNGAYYTKSRTLRRGSDGLTVDESKEADSTTGRAAHRLSRAIHDKGHTVSRNLQSDGNVDTMQILHNLDKDDLAGFDQTWAMNARKSLPGWSEGLYVQNGSGSSTQCIPQSRGARALPSTESSPGMPPGGGGRSGSSEFQNPGMMKVEDGDESKFFSW